MSQRKTTLQGKTAPQKKASLPTSQPIGQSAGQSGGAGATDDAGIAGTVAFMEQARDYFSGLPDIDEATGERHVPHDYACLLYDALRYAQTLDGASARCRYRECRDGSCHMRVESGEGSCPGGIRQSTLDEAAKMIGFLLDLYRRRWSAIFA